MPCLRSNYPKDWKKISHRIRFERAGGQCEWEDEDGRCQARHGQPHPVTGSKVVLTCAHLNHNTQDNRLENLKGWCQLHHLAYDQELHRQNAHNTRLRKKMELGQLPLPMTRGLIE